MNLPRLSALLSAAALLLAGFAHATAYAYDALGRRTARTLPAGQAESLAYDAAGNLGARRDCNGRLTTFAYDAARRLLARVPAGGKPSRARACPSAMAGVWPPPVPERAA